MEATLEEFAAMIGLDWADKKHDICLCAKGTKDLEFDRIDHTPESLHKKTRFHTK